MKICLISSADMDKPYGSTTRPYYISKSLAEFGCEILHICTSPPEVKEQNINIKYSLKKYYKNKLWIVRTCRDFFRMYKECKRFAPDIIYVHQISNAIKGLPLKYLLKKPFVFDAHGSSVLEMSMTSDISFYKSTLIKKQEEIILKAADKTIVVSNELKIFFIETFGISEEKIELIKNGVDTGTLKLGEPDIKIKKELNISDDDKVVVFTCPLSPINRRPTNIMGLKYLFELIPKIEERVENIKFVIVGDGGPKPDPPSPNVIYTGFVQDLASYINLADVCVAPYPPSAVCGGTRNKVADYFACGKPVVSTEEGMRGFDDAVPNRDFLLALDSEDFMEKLVTVLYDGNLSIKLGENARKLSLKYDWSSLSKKVFKTLESLM